MLFSRFIKSAAALLLLAIGFAAPAHAQNNKQIISGTWYEDRAFGSNANSSFFLAFSQTPSDKLLNITNVACHLQVNTSQTLVDVYLNDGTTSGAVDLSRPYSIKGSNIPETLATFKLYSIVQNGIFFKFGPGRYPTIEIDTATTGGSSATSASCTIVGNLTDN